MIKEDTQKKYPAGDTVTVGTLRSVSLHSLKDKQPHLSSHYDAAVQ